MLGLEEEATCHLLQRAGNSCESQFWLTAVHTCVVGIVRQIFPQFSLFVWLQPEICQEGKLTPYPQAVNRGRDWQVVRACQDPVLRILQDVNAPPPLASPNARHLALKFKVASKGFQLDAQLRCMLTCTPCPHFQVIP